MMRRWILLGVLFLFIKGEGVFAQSTDSLTLYECYRLVRQNAPQLKQLSLNTQAVELEKDKLTATNLPNVSAFGRTSYQSDALATNFPVPGIEQFELDLFQYNVGLNFDQKLFDGGMVSVQKDLMAIAGDIHNLETEISLYKLNELVNKYFFGVLIMQKSYEILELKEELLDGRRSSIESGIRNGVILKSDKNRLNAELATTQQQLADAEMAIAKLMASLKIMLGLENSNPKLIVPQAIVINNSINRDELELFKANRSYVETASKLHNKRYMPKFHAFGQTGYSYPGLNMFENKSDYYYIVGVKMAWQIFDWNHSQKEVQLLNLKKSSIDISQADFERNIEILSNNHFLEIKKLQELINSDQEIVSSKQAITLASSSGLKNGTITTIEYISDLNSELHSRLEMEIHKIKLKEAQANLAVVLGVTSE